MLLLLLIEQTKKLLVIVIEPRVEGVTVALFLISKGIDRVNE